MKLAAKVVGFMGDEYLQETTYSAYKDFDGIKKATKSEVKRDGEPLLDAEITEFKLLDEVEDSLFTEPK